MFQFGFYSSLLLIFFVHGLVYSILLFKKSLVNKNPSDKWLSLFLILCILYISPWMLGFAGWYDTQPYRNILFYTPFQHLYLIGPVVYFYVQSLLNPSFRFDKKQYIHLVPGIVYLLLSLLIVLTDKVFSRQAYFITDNSDPDFADWYQYSGFISQLFYFIASMRYYRLYRKLMVQVTSYADLLVFRWVRNFLVAFLIMLLLRLLFNVLSYMPAFSKFTYVGPWWEYFSFSIIFYFIAINGFSNNLETRIPFRLDLLSYRPLLLLPASTAAEFQNDHVEEAEVVEINDSPTKIPQENELVTEWKPKILNMVLHERIFEDPELSLSMLAGRLGTNVSVISKVINQGFGLNFNDFINHHRIEAVKEKIISGDHKTHTILSLAFDCGFNSKATFNRAFKKYTGQSPKEWIDQHGS